MSPPSRSSSASSGGVQEPFRRLVLPRVLEQLAQEVTIRTRKGHSDCCAALSDDEHRATLETHIQQFGDVATADEVLKLLS